MKVENVTPILSVTHMAVSRSFYVNLLGFSEDDWGTDQFTSIRRDGGALYLCQGAQGNKGTWIWIGFDGDIHELHDKLIAAGVKIRLAPTNYSWAMELHVEDPDGHVLRFGKEPDPSKPFEDGKGFPM